MILRADGQSSPFSSSRTVCRTQRVVVVGGERTWTVLDAEHRLIEPAEQFLSVRGAGTTASATGQPATQAGL